MDEYLKKRLSILGVLAILVAIICVLVSYVAQAKVKKNTAMVLRGFYSDMAQSMQFSMNSNGPPGDWGWRPGYKNIDLLSSYLVNYLKIGKNCISEKGECMPDVNYKTLGDRPTSVNLHKFPAVQLNNGISFAIEAVSKCQKQGSICAVVYADLNGVKEPNMFGQDLFVFLIVNSNSVAFVPYNARLPKSVLSEDKKYGCSKTSELAMYCSALLYANAWTIDNNYPW